MPEPKPFINCGKLFDMKDAFAHDSDSEALFEEAIQETMTWHMQNCPDFRLFMHEAGLKNPADFKSDEIPPLLVTIFKEFQLASIKPEEVKLELTSSGTGGRKSAIILDERSYNRILKIVDSVFTSLGLADKETYVNYICFTYDPKIAGNVGTAFSDETLTRLTKIRSVFYTLQWNEAINDFQFELEETVEKLISFASKADPVRILGFPAHLWQVCNELEKRGIKLDLGSKSFIITGGGWKMHKDQEVSKEEFKERVSSILGMPAANIRDCFGMVEHGIPYVDCEHGNLHIPVFSKAQVVDPETLEPFPENTEGMLKLITPYLSSYPSVSLLTTDKAVISSNCKCSRPGNTLKIIGRAGLNKHKGCAITALDLLK